MYVRRKVFSILSDETGEERLFSTNEVEYLGYEDYEIDDQREFADPEQREFGGKSKTLAVVSPGGWNAKEAAKYAYENDEDAYKSNRAKYALLGTFAPGTATYQLAKAKEMKKEGKSPKEIKKEIESGKVTGLGIGEVALGAMTNGFTRGIARLSATGLGMVHKLNEDDDKGNRAHPKKRNK